MHRYVIGHSPIGAFQDQCQQTMINIQLIIIVILVVIKDYESAFDAV